MSIPASLNHSVFHTVLVDLKPECNFPAETFFYSVRSVCLKLPPSNGINGNPDDERMA